MEEIKVQNPNINGDDFQDAGEITATAPAIEETVAEVVSEEIVAEEGEVVEDTITLTQEDLDANPELAEAGLVAGDEVLVPEITEE